MFRKTLVYIIFVFLSFSNISLAGSFQAPWLSGPVIDQVKVLGAREQSLIERRIRAINDSGKAQIQIYIASSLQGLTIEQASIELATQWGLGNKEKDNGLLLLIAPSERRLRLEVGQGLEGFIPDVYAKKITSDVMVPFIRQARYADAIMNAMDVIDQLLSGQEVKALKKPSVRQKPNQSVLIFLIFVAFILMRIFRFGGGRRFGSGYGYYGTSNSGGWMSGGGGSWSGGGGGFSGGGSSSSW